MAASFIAMLLYNYSVNAAFAVPGVQTASAYFDQKLRQADDSNLISRICRLAESLGLTEQMKQIQPPTGQTGYDKFYLMLRQGLNVPEA